MLCMETLNTMADRIRAARVARGMSRPELARRCRVSRGAVSHWELGRTKNLRNETLLKVSAALQVNMKWLLNGEGVRDLDLAPDKIVFYEPMMECLHLLSVEQLSTIVPMLKATAEQQAKGELQLDAIEEEPTPEVEK